MPARGVRQLDRIGRKRRRRRSGIRFPRELLSLLAMASRLSLQLRSQRAKSLAEQSQAVAPTTRAC
jgi:hypothetical protein